MYTDADTGLRAEVQGKVTDQVAVEDETVRPRLLLDVNFLVPLDADECGGADPCVQPLAMTVEATISGDQVCMSTTAYGRSGRVVSNECETLDAETSCETKCEMVGKAANQATKHMCKYFFGVFSCWVAGQAANQIATEWCESQNCPPYVECSPAQEKAQFYGNWNWDPDSGEPSAYVDTTIQCNHSMRFYWSKMELRNTGTGQTSKSSRWYQHTECGDWPECEMSYALYVYTAACYQARIHWRAAFVWEKNGATTEVAGVTEWSDQECFGGGWESLGENSFIPSAPGVV